MKKYYKDTIGSRIFDIFNVVFMIVFCFFVIYPFYNQFVISLNEGTDAMRGGLYFYPRKISFEGYHWLFQNPHLLKGAVISIFRVLVGTGTCLFATGLLAYIVTLRDFSGRRFMRVLFVVTMYFSGGLIPTYLLISSLGLTNSFNVYWIPGLINAYYMLLIASYIQNLPESMVEAPRIDGCSELRIYCQIILPLSLPVFAAVAVYLAVQHWNAWFDVMIYNPSGRWDTLQIYLRRLLLEMDMVQNLQNEMLIQSKFKNLKPLTFRAATTIVVTVPILVVYPFLQKYFIGGITIGAVKG
ncbi:carbohydrate ABC transporter permease [Ruminiclostridium cellobioparum]|uniref:ABC-type sugar transport system, permease component n=1 Tax=Ruminiclostridium cellobioparum subsp. termitidis CT1112 TaxID=1195236 RepID=S0FLV6_RUMCE|nr:carbohydrate ABC transporter permease [Ruminiclostridium cellobioparum]EMS73215.1 ABC-type sugar transport system, permease component [Ruminiclostridium cellobioparum subsp. termitidis CT1112]